MKNEYETWLKFVKENIGYPEKIAREIVDAQKMAIEIVRKESRKGASS